MAEDERKDTAQSLNHLLDGFDSLSNEYKTLAKQHVALRNQLNVVSDRYNALQKLVPANQQNQDLTPLFEVDAATYSYTSRNLPDWISDTRCSGDPEVQISLTSIRDAEFAAFKLKERLKSKSSSASRTKSHISRPGSMRDSCQDGQSQGKSIRGKRISFADMELDYTVLRKPGQLGCPFSSAQSKKSELAANTTTKHNLPTPRSSGSGLEVTEPPTRRTSFNDPIRPQVHKEPESADDESDQGSTGNACPIRFLDSHSPDEIAKYFEEHKHELPSSHAACVKRFQTSAESIRELDAKYGSLVTMIQGLGHKHQPMLPEARAASENAVQDDDDKSARKIKKWAKAISEHPGERPQTLDVPDTGAKAQSEGADDERVPHFDRPLKEIRVGESPSRPWGVPIPSKYLDKADRSDSERSVAGVARPAEKPRNLRTVGEMPSAAAGVEPSAIKGGCPFGHGQAAKDVIPGPLGQAKVSGAQDKTANDETGDTRVLYHRHEALHEEPQNSTTTPRIINHDLAFVADQKHLGSSTLENRGTLVLGYNSADIEHLRRHYETTNR